MSQTRITRRTFVSFSAAGAGLLALPSRTVLGANDRLNVAGIGVGGKGASDVSGSAGAGCNIVALCDVDQKRAAGTFKKFPKARRYTDFRVMLDNQKDIDAVTVSTPDHVHAPASVMAMKLGKHVYCQKPLTHSVYEARLMAETAAEMKVATQMGNQAHAGEPIRRGVEVIRAGILGKVTEVHTMTNRPIWPQGMTRRPKSKPVPDTLDWDLWLGPAPEREYASGYAPFAWRGWWDFGTGALGDMACHIMDMAYWALDLGAPEWVEANQGGNTAESPPRWSLVKYRFPARGENPPVTFSWWDGKKEVDEEGVPNLPGVDISEDQNPAKWDIILIGEKGKMFFNRGRTQWVLRPENLAADFEEPPRTIRRVSNEDAEWVEACKGGPAALSNFSYAGPFSEMVLLGNVAIRTGERILWDAKNLKATNCPKAEEFIRREYRKGWTL